MTDEGERILSGFMSPEEIEKVHYLAIGNTLFELERDDSLWKWKEPFFNHLMEQVTSQSLKDYPVFMKRAHTLSTEFFETYQLGMN